MQHKGLVNQIRITDAPMSNFYWSKVMSDPDIEDTLAKSRLYLVTQRPVHSFQNIEFDKERGALRFDIHQANNPVQLKIVLPLVQKDILSESDQLHDLEHPVWELGGTNSQPGELPNKENHSLMIYRGKESILTLWPERLLLFMARTWITAEVQGDIRAFLKYKVLYVGKAIKQHVGKRLSGHSALQKILSEEMPLVAGHLPTHEIALMFLEFHDNMSIQILDQTSTPEQFVQALKGEGLAEIDDIYSDAEKALIQALQPGYNKELYANYPKNAGGLYDSGLDTYTYTFMDPITLEYDKGSIRGGLHEYGGDAIVIQGDRMMVNTFDANV